MDGFIKHSKKHFCNECGAHSFRHIFSWGDELINAVLPPMPRGIFLNKFFEDFTYGFFTKLFSFFRLGSFEKNAHLDDIAPHSRLVINEAQKRGMHCAMFRSVFGYTNYIRMSRGNKSFGFLGIPNAHFLSSIDSGITADKQKTKEFLKRRGFPVADGRSFWIWEKKKAIHAALHEFGFPLVVKPRSGTQSQHVTTNIQNKEEFQRAIEKTHAYSPAFLIEKFIPEVCVHRATVIDFDFIACVKQMPTNVIGDGISTIQRLIHKKNSDPKRGEKYQKRYTLYKIIIDQTTEALLQEKRYTFATVPAKDEVIYLQKDPFLKLGGDLVDMTASMHPDNRKLFHDIAELFDIRVVGIDFLIKDITRSWKMQTCAVLELNDAPCIDMHHFPSEGESQNVAGAVMDLFFKYYV